MAQYRIPFNKPHMTGKEQAYIADAVARGKISGDGFYTKQCQDFLERELHVPKTLLTTSCTHALEMAAILLDLKPGDEVILPSFTFVSTANAFALRGARPIFADVRRDTLNLDETILEKCISSHTKAIVPVHYAGVGCAMDKICRIARKHNLAVVEDNAHGLFGKYGDKFLGTWGDLATQSFHETKNFICGEGGALIINNTSMIGRAEIIREKGTDRSRFFRGEVDTYTWKDIGSSYLPSDILAAYLYAQFEEKEIIQNGRKRIWHYYRDHLKEWARDCGIGLPAIPQDCEQTYHMFYLIMPTHEERNALIAFLKKRGIHSVFHYRPLHLSDMGRTFGGKPGDCPVTEDICDRLVRLPFFLGLSESDLQLIQQYLLEFRTLRTV